MFYSFKCACNQKISPFLLLLLFFNIFKTFFTALSSQWDFSHGKFGLLSLGKASCDRVALPNLRYSGMDYGIFNVRTDVNARNCSRGCTDTVRESALKVFSGRKISCCTGESNVRQRRADPTLYQLSYVPSPHT